MSWLWRLLLVVAGLFFVWVLAAWVWGGWLLLRRGWDRLVLRKPPEPPPVPADGFGQTAAEDVLYRKRFRACKEQTVAWHTPGAEEQSRYDAHPVLGRFGDFTIAVAEVDGRTWIVRERIWHGWPDPPEWAFFALEGDAIWAAADFAAWPRRWSARDALAPVADEPAVR